MTVPDGPMPQVFVAADTSSLEGQRRYMFWLRLKLGLVILAAACGLFSVSIKDGQVDAAALVAAILFVATLCIELLLWQSHPETDWYKGRALAESVKTLTWKLAVCGDPFPASMDNRQAADKFLDLCKNLRSDLSTELAPVVGEGLPEWILEVRSRSLTERREVYLKWRIEDQKMWYREKAALSRRRSRAWRQALMACEFLGFLAALGIAFLRVPAGLVGLLATVVGAIGVWNAAKQHDQNANAYSTAMLDLAEAEVKLRLAATDLDWAQEMNDAEDAISREHTVWLASRSRSG